MSADGLRARLLAFLGLDFEFSPGIRSGPVSPITEGLFVGSRPRPEDPGPLRAAGITHVVSCLPEDDYSAVSFLARDYQCSFVPVRDGIDEDIARAFPQVFAFAERAQSDHARAKLLVHCEAGVSRSATMAIALLMKSDGERFFEAFSRVRAARPEILPNIGFASQLQRLENALLPPRHDRHEPSSLARYLREACNVPLGLDALQDALERHDYDAPKAIRAVFGGDIPRVVQGVR